MLPEHNTSHKVYCITDTLYQSVQSTIYKAITQNPTCDVVIKCFEADAHDAFLREMAGFGMKHPNIVDYLDSFYLGKDNGCIVFQWYPLTLEKWLSEHGKVDETLAFQCLESILQALIYLNQKGRIHCDIKPHNIYMQFDSESNPQFVLGDLGSACSVQEAQEMRYTVSTPAYLAPERLYKNFYLNSDLYSLGIMGYELVVGSRPYSGTPDELTKAHLSKQPPLDNIPFPKLRDFIGQLMEKNPSVRILNAEIALYILRAIRVQHEMEVHDLKDNIDKIQVHAPIIPFGFFEKLQFQIAYEPKKVMLFQIEEHIVTLLEYDNYLELVYGKTLKSRLIMKTGKVQILDDSSFIYLNGNKLVRFDIKNATQICLYRFKETTNYFFCDFDYLLFSNKYRTTYLSLKAMQSVQFSQSNYLTDRYACIFADGSFCLSGGPYNQEIIWRDKEAQPIFQWQLEGPIIGLTNTEDKVLALTIDLQNVSKYVIWAIKLNAEPQKVTLAGVLHLYTHTQGYFFWLTCENQLFTCDADLTPIALGKLPIGQLQAKTFYLTFDHRWLVILAGALENENTVYCYKTHGA